MTLTHMPGHLPRIGALRSMMLIDEGKVDKVHNLTEEKTVAFVLEPLAPGEIQSLFLETS